MDEGVKGTLLDKLRGVGSTRPIVDPELAGGLREWLEDALSVPDAHTFASRRPMRVTERTIRPTSCTADESAVTMIVRTLFTQWVTTSHFDNPLEDALAGLAVAGDIGGTVDHVSRMHPDRRAQIADQVQRHAASIGDTWPLLCPAWYPRVRDRLSIPLCGGRIVLGGCVDLAIGAQAGREASVCVVEVNAGQGSPSDKVVLHFKALLETLRSGAAPCRVATYYTGDGRLDVESVDEHMLVDSLLHAIEAINRLRAPDAEHFEAVRNHAM